MRKTTLYLLAATLFVMGCAKHGYDEKIFAEEEIVLDAAPEATRGMLNAGNLTYDGTSFRAIDYLSGYNGTISGHTNGEAFCYFDNSLTYKSAATDWKWVFGDVASPTSYRWTRTGIHHFFGWLMADAMSGTATFNTSSRFSTYTYNSNTRRLNLASTLTTDASNQYDFLYSDIVPVNVLGGIPQKVDLPMKHLFGALGISITNNSDTDVTVKRVYIENFPNSGTATLDYSDLADHVAVTCPDPTKTATDYWPDRLAAATSNAGIVLYNKNHATQSKKVYDVYTGQEVTDENPLTYYMAWPVTLDAIYPTSESMDADGNITYGANSPLICVEHQPAGGSVRTYKIRFPRMEGAVNAITAGMKTSLNLQFANKQMLVSFNVIPWQYEEFPMAFEGDAISSTQLKFVDGTYVDGGTIRENGVKHQVIKLTQGANPPYWTAIGRFRVYTPVNAVLSVALSGNTQDFEVSLQSGNETSGGTSSITINPQRDGGLITLSIKPKGSPASGSRVALHFAVRNNGRDSVADTEINRDNYIIEYP